MTRAVCAAVFLLIASPAFANAGIFQTYVVLDRGSGDEYYAGGKNAAGSFTFDTRFFAPASGSETFTLRGAQVKTFENGSDNVYQASLFYRVYRPSGSIPDFTQYTLPDNNTGGDETRTGLGINLDLKNACGMGFTCTLEIYWRATSSQGFGTLNTEYFDSNNGANFARPFGVSPFNDSVADNAGYRLLSSPMTNTTVGTLAGINLVQGVTDQYVNAADNLFLAYTGSGVGYQPADNAAEAVPAGKGFYWLWYDQNIMPSEVPASFGTGTSRSYELSGFMLSASDNFATGNVTVGPAQGLVANGAGTGGSGFYMIGNPFAYPLLASGITADPSLGTIFQAWEPSGRSSGTYRAIDATMGQALARWQGVFAEIGNPTATAPTFTFDALATRAQTPQGPYYRGTNAMALAFRLDGTTEAGAETRDEAAIVRLLPDALDGWDRNDASKLTPPAGPYALLAPVTTRDGAAYRTAVTSLPDDGQARTVPLAFLATDAGTYTLSWDASLADGASATLHDLATGAIVDLGASEDYTFTSAAADWAERFELVLSPRGATAAEDAAGTDGLRVLAPRPNPSRGTSEVTVEVGTPQRVRADLFDALGRRVASVYDAAAPAGALALRLVVSGLAPGVYVLRVRGDVATATRTVTVTR